MLGEIEEYFIEGLVVGDTFVFGGEVVRYELPNIAALNFVMKHALGGGVTRSLAQDAHGKSLSSALLDLEIFVEG